VPAAEDFLFLFFSPLEARSGRRRAFWERRQAAQDADAALRRLQTMKDAAKQAIMEWAEPRGRTLYADSEEDQAAGRWLWNGNATIIGAHNTNSFMLFRGHFERPIIFVSGLLDTARMFRIPNLRGAHGGLLGC